MRQESSQRVLFSMTLLAMLWVVVYWSWGPSEPKPLVSFDDPSGVTEPTALTGSGGRAQPAITEPSVGGVPPIQDAGATGGAGEGAGLRVARPEFRTHVIQPGETLEDIALQEYGERRLWRVIAEANPLRDVERIRAGDTLRVPVDPNNVQGVIVDQAGERASPQTPPAPEFVEYVVKPGDTLSEISQAYYGTIRNADLIYQANRDSLSSPDDLKLGQTIRLPAAPTPAPAPGGGG